MWVSHWRPVPQRLQQGLVSTQASLPGPSGATGDALFDRLSIELEAPVDLMAVRQALQAMARAEPALVRAKGFLRDQQAPQERLLLQQVGQRCAVEPLSAVIGEARLVGPDALVLIGLKGALEPDSAALSALLAALAGR